MKKILAMLLAFTMMIAMAMPAFATGTDGGNGQSSTPATGSITINSVGSGTTYEIYRILDLKSYDKTKDQGTYDYQYNEKWDDFFTLGEGKNYIAQDENGVFKWYLTDTSDAKIAEFAKKALAYAKANSISPDRSSKNSGEFVVSNGKGVFSNLPLGYYLVDSTMGALCGLTTTNPDASVNAKNGVPTIEKQVMEDSTGQYGKVNTADIGQIVEYRVTINVHAGAENYKFHDKMESGLTFEQDTKANKTFIYPNEPDGSPLKGAYRGVWKIEHVVPGSAGTASTVTAVPKEYYNIILEDKNTTEKEIEDDCNFEILFTSAFCEHLKTNDKIIIYYNAMLNRHAIIAGSGNRNTAWLKFGEGGTTNVDFADTKTYSIDLVKTDGQNSLLSGAAFKIYDGLGENASEVKVVYLKNANDTQFIYDSRGKKVYRRARANEDGIEILVDGGMVTIVGFDNGDYYLKETTVPHGYSELQSLQLFTISDSNLNATFNGDIYSTGSGVHVVNHSGQMLPETGGAGTVMFITCGMTVVLGAGVLLVTKKRMNMIK